MAVTNFSPLLGLALPTTGDLSGTWGVTVNDAITSLIDSAVAGTTTLSADADVTLSTTNGAANQARSAVVLWTASNGATTRNITAPAQSKAYVVINAGTGSVVIRGSGPTTGVTVTSGTKALIAWNGSDFVTIVSSGTGGSGTVTSVSVASSNGFAGTVANATTTPAITLTTSITGILKGNATAISAAVAGTDYVTPTGTETLTNKTLTAPTIASANLTTALTLSGAAGTNGQVLTSAGAGFAPTWATSLLGVTDSASPFETSLGYQAGDVSTGVNNTFVGYQAGLLTTSATNVTAVGFKALDANITGVNTAIGSNALGANTTGSTCTAVGYNALLANTTANSNAAFGTGAGGATTVGGQNTYLGESAGPNATTADANICVGYASGNGLTTGSANIAIGGFSPGIGIVPAYNITTENNRISMGSTSVTNAYIQVGWTTVSDARDKTNFGEVPHGLDFVNQLKPVSYQFKESRKNDVPVGDVKYGFRAQDILALEGENSVIIDSKKEDKLYYNGESLVPVLVKALQELNAKFDAYVANHT